MNKITFLLMVLATLGLGACSTSKPAVFSGDQHVEDWMGRMGLF